MSLFLISEVFFLKSYHEIPSPLPLDIFRGKLPLETKNFLSRGKVLFMYLFLSEFRFFLRFGFYWAASLFT